MFVPYSIHPMNAAPAIRAYKLYHALKKIVDVTLISRPSYNFMPNYSKIGYLNFLLSLFGQMSSEIIQLIKKNKIDYVYIEAFGAPLHSFDYVFLNALKKRDIPIFPFIMDTYWKYPEIFKRNAQSDKYCQMEYGWYLKNATALLFPSETMANTVNFPEKFALPPAGDPSRCLNQKLPDNKNITYMGEISPAMGIDILMKSIEIVIKKQPDAQFTIVGHENKELMVKCKNKNYITFMINKTYKDIPNILSDTYATIIPRQVNPYNDFAMPVKLLDYMSSGRPVITTNCHETARFIQENNCGIITEDNPNSIAKGILKLLENRDLAEIYGKNAFLAIKNKHSWKHRAEELVKIMEKY